MSFVVRYTEPAKADLSTQKEFAMHHFLLFTTITLACTPMLAAESNMAAPPIQAIEGVAPGQDVFKSAKRGEPLVLKTADEAGKFFGDDALAALEEKVDFDQQVVLVFAWRGSGQDKLTYDVAESFPEQVQFKIEPGLTRDLRSHVKVFALRSNVKWSVGR